MQPILQPEGGAGLVGGAQCVQIGDARADRNHMLDIVNNGEYVLGHGSGALGDVIEIAGAIQHNVHRLLDDALGSVNAPVSSFQDAPAAVDEAVRFDAHEFHVHVIHVHVHVHEIHLRAIADGVGLKWYILKK